MITLNDKLTQIDDVLDKMAEAIQLDDTRYDRMKSAYEAVKEVIENDEMFFKPYNFEVYPHGSVRILTAIKPLASDEFDLDIAIHIKSNVSFPPSRIYTELKRVLLNHGVYKDKVEPKNRCIRLNYAGDFHMDILPGIQEYEYDDNRLKVPDRELNDWVSSNPRGYADWFKNRVNLLQESLLEKALRAEKLPTNNFKYKKPLHRAVQLIKRYRDEYFQKDDTYKTSSIVLTTIAGYFYQGEESIFDAVDGIITNIRTNIVNSPVRIKVLNPVNKDEDFTDKWDAEPQYYTAFKSFCEHLHNEWQKLKMEQGLIVEGQILKGLFGCDLFESAQRLRTANIEQQRKENALRIDRTTGTLTNTISATTSAIKSNTFFGD